MQMAKNWTCESMNCGYYWQNKDEDYPSCHCPNDGFPAPCEYEDDYDEYDDYDDCDYECGYDPYMGCFTDDC